MGAGFDPTKAYKVPLAGFFVAMLVAAWLMTRLGPYRYAAEKPHEAHSVAPLQAESLAWFRGISTDRMDRFAGVQNSDVKTPTKRGR